MKTKALFSFLLVVFYYTYGFAQQGEIIYKTYPDEWIIHTGWGETFYDVNNDSVSDIRILTFSGYAGHLEGRFNTVGDCECCCYSIYDYSGTGYNNFYLDASLPLNDPGLCWGNTVLREERLEGDTSSYKPGLRINVGDAYFYGWFRAYTKYDEENNVFYFKVTETCFCSIPNFPLKWGQTSLTGIEENGSTAFVTLHPNPTSGLVTITGQDLRQAEVINTLGQQVATATGAGETLQIDIANLPIGVYFVNVTDGEGRKCVRKVVKE